MVNIICKGNKFFDYVYLRTGCASLDQKDIAILDDIILTLGHDFTSSLDRGFITILPKSVVVVNNCLNEGLFKVAVDYTGRGWCLGVLPDGPLADFISTSGEETGQVENLAHLHDGLGQTRFSAEPLALLLGFRLGLELGKTLLERGGDGKDRVSRGVGLNPLHEFRNILVLLTDVVLLAQVDQVDNWFSSEEEQRVDDFDLQCLLVLKET